MKDPSSTTGTPPKQATVQSDERLVYVMPESAFSRENDEEIDLLQLWDEVCRSRWRLVSVVVICTAIASVLAFSLPKWYLADTVLAPAEQNANEGISSPFGNLVDLAGLNTTGNSVAEAIAVLESRDFTRTFIEEENLMPILFHAEWDDGRKLWKGEDPEDWPDIREGVEFFDEEVRRVKQDRDTSLVTLMIEWKDPTLAAAWSNELASRLNDHMRSRALNEAKNNVSYLQQQLSGATLVTLQQSISRLLETEFKKLMLAQGNEEFVFRIIDRAEVPKFHSSPKRALLIISAALLAGLLSVAYVSARHVVRRRERPEAKPVSSVREG